MIPTQLLPKLETLYSPLQEGNYIERLRFRSNLHRYGRYEREGGNS